MTSKFVSFLKKLGQIVAAGAQVAETILPALAPFINLAIPASKQANALAVETTIGNDLNSIFAAVTAAESAGAVLGNPGLTGAQKAAMAGAYIGPIFLNAEALAGQKVANPAAANAAFVTIAGGIADFLNSLDGSALPTAPPPTTTPAPATTSAPAPATS
jgi:hypothetical protein